MPQNILVLGAGQAAAALLARLRALGYKGALTLVGEEDAPPYQRPPLSKAYLLGTLPRARLFLRPESFYADEGITLHLGTRATHIDRAAKTVTLANGKQLSYDALVLTLGASARALPAALGGALPGVFTLRNLQDAEALRPALRPGARALILGGGYIGLEAAAVARQAGLSVTLLEAAPRILARVAAPETAAYFRALHQSEGVDLREGTALAALEGGPHVTGARLADGRFVPADFVIAGIGAQPNTGLAEAAGLALDNGIAVDAFGQTSDPAIWAAGDCASFPYRGGRLRLESVQNAIDQAENAAENLLGAAKPYAPQPWFWSDQYKVKLQIAGLSAGYTQAIARAEGEGALSVWYFAGGAFCAVDAMNAPRAFMIGKRLLEQGRAPDPARLADPSYDLKALLV